MKRWLLFPMAMLLLAACSSDPVDPDPDAPVATAIDSFGATPNPSPLNVGVSFSWTVMGSNLTCTLDAEGDGTVDYTVQDCSSQSRVVHTYGAQGAFEARLTVTGADGQTRIQTAPVTISAANLPPTIPTLQPQVGGSSTNPLQVSFVWSVDDRNSDITHCQFDADSDGKLEYDNLCSGLPTTSGLKPASTVDYTVSYRYPKSGRYTATLTASDPYSATVSRVKVRVPLNAAPRIDAFTATAGTDFSATLFFRVSDADDDELKCTLSVATRGKFTYLNCDQLTRVFSSFEPGSYAISLSVTDGLETTSKTITLVVPGSIIRVPVPIMELGESWGCMTLDNVKAYCWGGNWSGQVGDGTTTDRLLPTVVGSPPGAGKYPFSQLGTGYEYACALNELGQAYCWGILYYGIGQTWDEYHTPTAVIMPTSKFTLLTVGSDMGCGQGENRQLYCWGNNVGGAVGDGTNTDRHTPTAVVMPTDTGFTQFTQLTAGYGHVCGLGNNGKAYCWGYNSYGALGDNTTNNRNVPTAVSLPSGVVFTQISAGASHTCALGNNNKAYCWGKGDYGKLGNDSAANVSTPDEVRLDYILPAVPGLYFTQISAGRDLSCALGNDGIAYCWGKNSQGALGDNKNSGNSNKYPVAVTMPTGVKFTMVRAGSYHACALGDDMQVYCWGWNNNGELGINSKTEAWVPTPIVMP